MKAVFSKAFLTLLMLGLCACGKSPLSPVSHDSDALWQNYAKSAQSVTTPFRTQLSLRYGVEGSTDRVQGLLWGNSSQKLRLDIAAGVGVTMAKIFEDQREFIIYIPQEEKAYVHKGEEKPLFNVGVPMPLGLNHLVLILQGHYASVFGLAREGSPMPLAETDLVLADRDELPAEAVAYTLEEGQFRGTLVLSPLGLPIYWQEDSTTGWTIALQYREHENIPYKLEIKHIASERKAVLIVKERASDLDLFTPEQMRLIFPKETTILPLEDLQNDA